MPDEYCKKRLRIYPSQYENHCRDLNGKETRKCAGYTVDVQCL
uniref:Uncharacterized protein n=1 Tax=Anguilla anguilla TaxID=7936 RepID=A0A0E9U0U6_ANGAN